MLCAVCQLPSVAVAEATRKPKQSPSSGRECPFCQTVFSRADGATRHALRCPKREGRALPCRKRGRKTRSCDQCSRAKVHCTANKNINNNDNNQSPCEHCFSRKLDCTFSRYCTDVTHRQSSSTHTLDKVVVVQRQQLQGRFPLSFILNVTDDKLDFVTEREVGEEPDGDLLGPTRGTTPPPPPVVEESFVGYIDPTLLLLSSSTDYSHNGFVDTRLLMYNNAAEEQNLLGAFLTEQQQQQQQPQQEVDRGLAARLDFLELEVSAHHHHHHSKGKDSFDSTAFRRFFTVTNVHEFATIFCRKRHYQYPIIHWPTFSLEDAALPLIMVVALTGATYSYRPGREAEEEYVTRARELYHIADSYIFHQLETFVGRLPSGGVVAAAKEDEDEAIQLCQAALLMYALNTLSTTSDIASTERLPTLVSALRRLGFINCRHDPTTTSTTKENWQLFLRREKIIRLVTWTFCSDCLAILSYNSPPKFSLQEMEGELPCDAAVWDADSEEDFERLRSSNPVPSNSLRDLMARFLEEDNNNNNSRKLDDDNIWKSLPLYHLHVMLCAFHPIVFNLHAAMFLPQQSQKLLQALEYWRHLWARCMEAIPPDQRKWLGVSKYVSGLEYLTRRIIEVSASPQARSSPYLRRIPSCGTREIHQFIRDYILNTIT
ncbi:hypothetical protein GGS20DRAFT_453309 [Poronia punctata]|nr:hypothetical protein GGS20DRAFT_453309 [Poronia punctata]